ncbi:MAG: lactate utilization protein [Oscillospiraceae bacterium]|nr:lactate utilization protein [Oscillospiraceae bacterium]
MNEFAKQHLYQRLERTTDALCLNRMDAHWCKTKEEALALVKTMLPQNAVVATGGSMTLEECGIIDLLRSGAYRYLDREAVAPEERGAIYRQAFSADVYLCSSNAVLESGALYNVDGNANRVAALTFGPESVIVVAGANKLVATLEDAVARVKRVAAPMNTMRLSQDTPCARCGVCAGIHGEMHKGCQSEQRICCSYVVNAWQRIPNRIKVILVAESLGY